ncbi:MAG: hypothetical protein LBQ12_06765, partial [Deltaproteobacteria bacterium]|nr:hypothetical protein [Deltaproteobacteria bacterium]
VNVAFGPQLRKIGYVDANFRDIRTDSVRHEFLPGALDCLEPIDRRTAFRPEVIFNCTLIERRKQFEGGAGRRKRGGVRIPARFWRGFLTKPNHPFIH